MDGSWTNAPGGGIVCGRAATPEAGWTYCVTGTGVGIGVGVGVGSGVGVGGGGSDPQAASVPIVNPTTIRSQRVDRLGALVTCCHRSESHPRKSRPQQFEPLYFAAQVVGEPSVP